MKQKEFYFFVRKKLEKNIILVNYFITKEFKLLLFLQKK